MPVVAVEDVGGEVEVWQRLEHRPAEKGEPLAVVVEAVQPLATEVVFVVDEIIDQAVILEALDAAVKLPPAEGHLQALRINHLLPPRGRDVAVLGHDDPHVQALAGQFLGQRAGDVGQAARLGERHGLGGDEQNLLGHHTIIPFSMTMT